MRRVRPLVWLVLGAAGVVTGLVLAVNAVTGLVRLAELPGVSTCTGDGSQDCLTRGPATVDYETSSRWQWMTGERTWFLDVSAIAPEVRGSDDTPQVTVPDQPGQDEIREGMKLTVVYHGGHPILLELADSIVLETDEHPRRFASTLGYLAISTLGLGGFVMLVGWQTGRRRGWSGRVYYEESKGSAVYAAVPFFAGGVGAITQAIAGASPWPALIAALVVAGVLGFLLFRAKRRLAARSPIEPDRSG